MTLAKFQRLLKKIDPKLRVRIRGTADIAGLFVGVGGKGGYIMRLTKGELHLNGYRNVIVGQDGMTFRNGYIKKRGRKTVINKLRNFRWLTNHKQVTMLTYGIEYPDAEVRGITRRLD